MNVQFRQTTIEDLSELCLFSREVFFDTYKDSCSPEDMNTFLYNNYSADQIRSELLNPASSFFFLYMDCALAGYIKINEASAQSDIHDVDALELERIYVSREVQGKGLGSFLMKQTVAIAKQKEKKYIWLGVWEKNRRAISFYRKHGFYIIGTHEFVIGEDIQTDYIMRRDLKSGERNPVWEDL